MKDKEKLRERFLRDPLPRRLGGLAATASQNPKQRILLSVQAKDWSDKAVDFSGLVQQYD
ncbi:MAG: hypothetical protein ABIL11_10025 [Chloroflexota bacterium]